MNEQNNNTRLIKIFLIGDSDVGKTSILKQFIENRFDEINQFIIGIDFRYVHIDNDNQPTKLVIWDPSGQSRFKEITRLYYKKTNIVIFVYSITDRKSFINMIEWFEDIEKYAPPNTYKVLVGNKSDLEAKRKVTYEEGEIISQIYNCNMFYETSAKDNTNIKEIFVNSVMNIIELKDN
jgi:small GTP-binding protein